MGVTIASAIPKRSLSVLRLGRINHAIFEKFFGAEASTTAFLEIIEKNQLYAEAVHAYVEGKRGASEERPTLSFNIQLLGILGTRNLLAAIRSSRVLGEPWPFPGKNLEAEKPVPKKATQKIFNPDDYLKIAAKVQEFAAGQGIDQAEGAGFAAGLAYDRIERLLMQDPRKNAEALEYLKLLTRESLKFGLLASRIAGKVPGFGANRFAFGVAFAANIGKLVLAVETKGATPSWAQYLKTREKLDPFLRWQNGIYLERDRFGFSFEELSVLLLQGFGMFTPFLESIHFHRLPYFLKGASQEQFQMAAVLNLASLLQHLGKPVEKGNLAIKEISNSSWWKVLKIREAALVEISKEAAAATF